MSLVIVEGPDCAGKTTLIGVLGQRLKVRGHQNHGAYLGESRISRRYIAALNAAIQCPGDLILSDRSWLSEPIYGKAMRGGLNRLTERDEQMLTGAAWVARTVVVLCLPPYESCRTAWALRGDDYVQREPQLREVYDLYAASVERWRATLPVVLVYDRSKDTVEWLVKAIGRIAE